MFIGFILKGVKVYIVMQKDSYLELAMELCNKSNKKFIKLIGTNSKAYVYYICMFHSNNGEQKIRFDHLKNGHGCPFCANRHPTTDDLINHKKLNKNVKVIGTYVRQDVKIDCQCRICNHLWSTTPNHLIRGQGCPKCGNVRQGKAKRKTEQEVAYNIRNARPLIQYIGGYTTSKDPCGFRCKVCGYEWNALYCNVLNGRSGCKICGLTLGEKKVRDCLEILNLSYDLQYEFKNCIYKGVLKFDFYLPDHHVCIEYQGEQHYNPIDFANKGQQWAENNLKLNQTRDNVKRKYCALHKITLIEIPYWEFEQLESFLISKLKSINI